MTDADKIMFVKNMFDDEEIPTDKEIKTYLTLAKNSILQRLYPFESSIESFPSRYDMKQCEIAVYMLNKRGAEGETGHSENGISRSYESASVPDSMLRDIMPFCGVFK